MAFTRIPAGEWAHDFGVRFGDDVITIEGMVDALTMTTRTTTSKWRPGLHRESRQKRNHKESPRDTGAEETELPV